MRIRMAVVVLAGMALAGCADGKKDYDATTHCQGVGLQPGTAEYDKCVNDETMGKMMEQQRRDYEMMKQQDQDRKMRQY